MATKTGGRRVRRSDSGAATDVRRDEFTTVTDALQNVNNVTRAEFVAATDDIRQNIRELATQLTRIGQIQAELDEVKRTLAKLTAAQPERNARR
jgi:hypothetical protein